MTVYYYDRFAGTPGTLLTNHTSDSGATWPNDTNHVAGSAAIELDGNGMIFSTSVDWIAQLSSATMPTSNFEITYTMMNLGGTSVNDCAGVTICIDSPLSSLTDYAALVTVANLGTDWFYNNTTAGFDNTLCPVVGQLYYIKILVLSQYGTTTCFFYISTDGSTWITQDFQPSYQFPTPTSFAVGPIFSASTSTATTGIHIGDLVVRDVVLGTPNSEITKAHVASSGESIAVFFDTDGTPSAPQFMLAAPTVYKNGTSMGLSSEVVIWINSAALCMVIPLPSPVLYTDVVTMTTTSGWMMLANLGIVGAATNLAVTNYVGQSCFGTESLARTLKPGVNVQLPGVSPSDCSQAFKNMAGRLNINGSSNLPTPLGYEQTFDLVDSPRGQGSQLPSSFGTPTPIGYYAIGYDDEYLANGGSPTGQLILVPSYGSTATITQMHAYDNTGALTDIGQMDQYYIFEVTSSNVYSDQACFNASVSLQYPTGSGNTYITNLWIIGPGEFTYPPSTPFTFNRSNPYEISNAFLTALPNSVGCMRVVAVLSGSESTLCEPWEGRQVTDVSWNGNNWSVPITYTTLRPFVTSVSPYIYADQFGSPWTALSSPLATGQAINSTQATITLTHAQTECGGTGANATPLFYGIMIAIGGQGGSGTLEYMRVTGIPTGTSVPVARGSAFNGVLTSAVAHNVGETVTLCNRYAWTTLANLPNWWGGIGHQTVEVVCFEQHKLKSGVQTSGDFASSYPVEDTNDVGLTTDGDGGIILVTGATTFVVSWWNGTSNPAATLNTSYAIPSPSVNFTNVQPGGAMPYEYACKLTSAFDCDLHILFPLLASDSYIYERALQMLGAVSAGRKIHIELANEPFTFYFVQDNTTAISSFLGQTNWEYWYVLRLNQIAQIVKTVFAGAGRESEIHVLANGGPDASNILGIAQTMSPAVQIDDIGIAPYYAMDMSLSSVQFCNNATINQIADLLIHQVYYLPGSVSFNTGVPGSEFSTTLAFIDSYNTATGYDCQLYGYEGGYSYGAPNVVTPAGPTGNNLWFNYQASFDVRYLPVWRIYEKDFYAFCQTAGYVMVNTYAESLYYFYGNCWNIYTWINQIPGLGDGTDGKFDNRTSMQTPCLTGPTYFSQGYIGPGAGTVTVTAVVYEDYDLLLTVEFSIAPTLSVLNYIWIQDDPANLYYYVQSGSGTGPYTLYTGTSGPATYAGPMNTASSWSYGTATSQDQKCVSVRGQALLEWMQPAQGKKRMLFVRSRFVNR